MSFQQTLPHGFTFIREREESIVVNGISLPHYRIALLSPVDDTDDAAPGLDIDFIMGSIKELDVRCDYIDGFLIAASCEKW